MAESFKCSIKVNEGCNHNCEDCGYYGDCDVCMHCDECDFNSGDIICHGD